MEAPVNGQAAVQSNKERLRDFYAKFDEAKVDKVDAILAGWPLEELKEALRKKYGECPDLVPDPPPKTEAVDDMILSSGEDSDLAVVSCEIKKMKPKKKVKKDKKGKKEKKNKAAKENQSEQAANLPNNGGLSVLSVNIAPPKVPKNWGSQWWAQAMKDVNSVKRRLTQKAMKFVDEAVRRSREEKERQAIEKREARQTGKSEKDMLTVLIEEDVEEPEAPEESYLDAQAPEIGDDELARYENSGFKPASGSEDDEDDDNRERTTKKRKKRDEGAKAFAKRTDEPGFGAALQ